MKKVITSIALMIMLTVFYVMPVNAVTSQKLADQLYAMGSPYGMTTADKVKIQRYVDQYGVTDDQANAVVEEASKATQILKTTGTKNLSTETKNQLKTIATEIGKIIDVTVVFTSDKTIDIYKDNVKIESISTENRSQGTAKLPYTGNNYIYTIAGCGIGIIALATVVFIRRK